MKNRVGKPIARSSADKLLLRVLVHPCTTRMRVCINRRVLLRDPRGVLEDCIVRPITSTSSTK
jgi:hypothetical protein